MPCGSLENLRPGGGGPEKYLESCAARSRPGTVTLTDTFPAEQATSSEALAMDEKPNDPTSGRHTTGEIARTIVTQSLYNLVRLTRFGFQAAATGFGKIEESMARRQQ